MFTIKLKFPIMSWKMLARSPENLRRWFKEEPLFFLEGGC